MQFATILKITAGSTLLVAASAANAVTYTFNQTVSTNWATAANWSWDQAGSPSGPPTAADEVIIADTKLAEVIDATAYADTLTVYGQVVIDDQTLEVDDGIAIDDPAGVKLDDAVATLKLLATMTISDPSGTNGYLHLHNTGALVEMASGITATFSAGVRGFGSISAASGTATLVNGKEVIANDSGGAALELASDLILSDSADKSWTARDGGKLEFKRQQTSGVGGVLQGNVTAIGASTLHFFESVTFDDGVSCGGGGALFTWGSSGTTSTLTIQPNKTFMFKCFSSPSCPNPGTGSSPYSVAAGGSQYSQTCSPP